MRFRFHPESDPNPDLPRHPDDQAIPGEQNLTHHLRMILLLALALASTPVVLVFGYLWASSPSENEKTARYKATTLVSAAWLLAFLFSWFLGVPAGRYGFLVILGVPLFLTYHYFFPRKQR
ncbi:hypothetical protein [Thauera sp.]|uniref:hypothetical protein n=1 Tax=Thauera sp. TaxID=1905334 RepID=UPI0039E604E0